MNMPHLMIRHFARACILSLIGSASVLAASAEPGTQARARYRQDMAVCSGVGSYQDPATCRLEARNALAEALHGGQDSVNSAQYSQNALRRCQVHQGDDRTACEARMTSGEIEGSATGGGILRKSTTQIPAE